MKQLLYGLFSLAGAFGLWTLLAAAQPLGPDTLPAVLVEGTTMLDLNLAKGTGIGFAGLAADTPVAILEVSGAWLLLEFPTQTGGPTWVNSAGIVSCKVRR